MADEFDPQQFHDDLVAHRLIIPVGVPGAFGRGAVFEDVLERFNGLVSALARDDGAELYTFPPVIDRKVLERVDYMDSFPQLSGAVFSFFGKELTAKELSERIHAGKPWGDLLGITDVTLNPAACYPVYPSLAGELPADGRLVTMLNWVYRHEPSPEPTRMQSFRVREFVRAGTPDMVVAWRDMWLQRGLTLLQGLGLPAVADVASDPFFGRGGRILAAGQREQKLKFEVLVPVISKAHPTAVCSFNYHQEHFGKVFDIRTAPDTVAHTACLGFGLERVVMALFRTHGFDPHDLADRGARAAVADDLIVVEPSASARAVVVLLHGFEMEPDELAPFARALVAGGVEARFVLPRAPWAASQHGRQWWDDQVPAPDLAPARAHLLAVLDRVAASGVPLVVGGFSQGGMAAFDLLRARRVDAAFFLSAAVVGVGALPRLDGVPALVAHGLGDPWVDVARGEALRDALAAAGAAVTWLPFDGAHETPLLAWRAVKRLIAGAR